MLLHKANSNAQSLLIEDISVSALQALLFIRLGILHTKFVCYPSAFDAFSIFGIIAIHTYPAPRFWLTIVAPITMWS